MMNIDSGTPPGMADGHLVSQALAGHGASFDTLVRTHQKRILHFVLRHIDNPADAEELVQETFLQAHRSLESFQGNSQFSTWVTGIALNLVRNHANRSPQYRYQFLDDEHLQNMAGHDNDPLSDTEFEHLLERTGLELERLNPELRDSLVMVAMEGMPYEEVAERTGTNVNNVKNRLFRARRSLRAALLEDPD